MNRFKLALIIVLTGFQASAFTVWEYNGTYCQSIPLNTVRQLENAGCKVVELDKNVFELKCNDSTVKLAVYESDCNKYYR